jgi:hypothetical protein
MMRSSVRKFICKRCDKKSVDNLAQAKGVLQDGTKWEDENIDLCTKCFKKTRKERSQTIAIRDAMQLGLLSENDLGKIQDDPQFKKKIFEQVDEIQRKALRKRNDRVKGIGVSPSDEKRKDSRKVLQGLKGIEEEGNGRE